VDARVQAYLRGVAARGRETERIGPFLATFDRASDNPFLNYAIPDDGARPPARSFTTASTPRCGARRARFSQRWPHTATSINATTPGNYSQRSFSLASWRGQTVRVQFRATTDFSLPTSFRIDDVSLR
jgi:hypothetical protein